VHGDPDGLVVLFGPGSSFSACEANMPLSGHPEQMRHSGEQGSWGDAPSKPHLSRR